MARNTSPRKQTLTYFFSVEGETEKWYLEWLEAQINATENAKFKVKLKAEVQKDPISFAKKLTVQAKTIVWHLSDIEGSTPADYQAADNTLSRLKETNSLGKSIVYKYGYSNLSFDLWMILHKRNHSGSVSAVGNYLALINSGYGEQFPSMKKYKEHDNFHKCLRKLTIADVCSAIDRAKTITQRNASSGNPLHQFKGYKYYMHNPALDIWQPIEKILTDCGLI